MFLAGHGHRRFPIERVGLALLAVTVLTVTGLLLAGLVRRRRRTARSRAASSRAGDAGGSDVHRTPREAIAAAKLSKVFQMGRLQVQALDNIDIAVERGTIACIMGKSGSGKSTLLRQLGLIDSPSSGQIWLDGAEVTGMHERERSELRLRRLGYVFQEYALLPELTAAENVFLPAMMAGVSSRDCRRRAAELLDLVGLAHRAGHRPRELSGGEQQRVAIARALVNQPEVIFADEPTANLDSASALTVMQTLRRLRDTLDVTVLFVSHDPDDARYAAQLIHLADGRTVASPEPGRVSSEAGEARS